MRALKEHPIDGHGGAGHAQQRVTSLRLGDECALMRGAELARELCHALGLPEEERSWIYVLRMIAFLIIIAAIVRKNYHR